VKKHLENMYTKLGVHTRTAAAAFVRERRPHAQDD
jgi:DNA-binding NarL/FixJ family response regulator